MDGSILTILDVLEVWPCARAIFEHVPAHDLVRSERVSRRWQHAVHDYLQATRNLHLISGYRQIYCDESNRIIEINNNKISWSLLTKTVQKLGSYIDSLTTHCDDAEHLKIVEMSCPYLQNIEFYDIEPNSDLINKFESVFNDSDSDSFKKLKRVEFINSNNMIDLLLSRPFRTVSLEKIVVENCKITGSFLKGINLDCLKSLAIYSCRKLNLRELDCVAYNLRNLTRLNLSGNRQTVFQNVHRLITKLPKLEHLGLCEYWKVLNVQSKQELLKSFSQLANLKHLYMSRNQNVDDELIDVVVRDCPKLEYMDIRGAYDRCVRSLAAACSRPPPAATTLCLDWIQCFTAQELAEKMSQCHITRDMQALGVIEVTPEWIEATARASQGPDHVEIQLRPPSPFETKPLRELKIKLASTMTSYAGRYMDL